MILRRAGLVALCVGLSGCGNEFEGSYMAASGMLGPVIGIHVMRSEAKVAQIDPYQKRVLNEETWGLETKGEKLLLTNPRGKTFAFTRAVDEKSLDCLNCGLGTGIPKAWQQVDLK